MKGYSYTNSCKPLFKDSSGRLFISWYFWHIEGKWLPWFQTTTAKTLSGTEMQILTIGNNFDFSKIVRSKGCMQERLSDCCSHPLYCSDLFAPHINFTLSSYYLFIVFLKVNWKDLQKVNSRTSWNSKTSSSSWSQDHSWYLLFHSAIIYSSILSLLNFLSEVLNPWITCLCQIMVTAIAHL